MSEAHSSDLVLIGLLRSTMGSPRKQLATEPLHHAHRQTGLSEPAALQPAALQRRSALRRLRQRPEARCSKS